MNERILKIAQQTDIWCDQNYSGDDHYDLRWEEKFAELIIRECITKYDEYAGHSSDLISFALARHNVTKTFGIAQ